MASSSVAPQFTLTDIKKVLSANSCRLIYTREELEPDASATATAKQSYETRKTTAPRILNASISETLYDTISAAAKRQDNGANTAAAKLAVVVDEDEIDDGSIYIADAESSYMSSSTVQWIIDSGASRHFSHQSSDFKSIKR